MLIIEHQLEILTSEKIDEIRGVIRRLSLTYLHLIHIVYTGLSLVVTALTDYQCVYLFSSSLTVT